MNYQATPWRVVNRDWKTYVADAKWVIVADTAEIWKIFEAHGFKKTDAKQETKKVEAKKA